MVFEFEITFLNFILTFLNLKLRFLNLLSTFLNLKLRFLNLLFTFLNLKLKWCSSRILLLSPSQTTPPPSFLVHWGISCTINCLLLWVKSPAIFRTTPPLQGGWTRPPSRPNGVTTNGERPPRPHLNSLISLQPLTHLFTPVAPKTS